MERLPSRVKRSLLKRWQPGTQPVLIVGNGRSGTTWVGNVVGMCRRGLYYHEPCSPGPSGALDTWFHYVRPGTRDPEVFEPPLDAAFGALPSRAARWQRPPWHRLLPGYRVVVKEIAALMSVEWVAERYRPKVVAVIRHPCAVALSELTHGTSPDRSLEALLRQTELFQDHLEPYRAVVEQATTPFEKLAAIWAARYRVVFNSRARRQGWLRVFYESLCANPRGAFRDLIRRLGLAWTEELQDYVEYSSTTYVPDLYSGVRISRQQINKWKKQMPAKEALSVRRIVECFQLPIYRSDEDWVL